MKKWLLLAALLAFSFICYSQSSKSVPKWLQDSWTVKCTKYDIFDVGKLYPRKWVVKVTITSDYVILSSTTDGIRTKYDFNNEKQKINNYDHEQRKLFHGDYTYLDIDEQRQRPYIVVEDEWGIKQRHYFERDSEIRQRETQKRQEEQRRIQEEQKRKQEEQKRKLQIEKITAEYNDSLNFLVEKYNQLLMQDKYNVNKRIITETFKISSAYDETSIQRQFVEYKKSLKSRYENVKDEIRNDYEREFNNKYNLFKSREEFDNAYTAKNYQEIVKKKLNTVVVADIQGKWRQVVRKADRNYMRLIIIDKTIKIKKATKTVYKGGFKIDDGIAERNEKKDEEYRQIIHNYLKKGFSTKDIEQAVILSADGYTYLIIEYEGKYYPIGFERYYGTDEKIAWYVTKKVLYYTAVGVGALIVTPFVLAVVLAL